MKLPIGVHRKLAKYSEEFPKGKILGPWEVIGKIPVVLDDGSINLRVRHENGKSEFKTIMGLRRIRTSYEL